MSKRKYIKLNKVSNSLYQLEFENDSNIGEFVMDVDGYFYWYPPINSGGSFPDYIIQEIGEKLIELNKKYDSKVKKYFSKQKKVDKLILKYPII